MSFQARLILGNNEYNVLDCDFDIHQPTGRNNLPNHHTEVGLINLVVESSSQSELWDWGMSNAMKKTGSVVFYRRDAVSPLKTLDFDQAFCIKYREVFNSEGSIPMRVYLTLSPFMMKMQGIGIVQPWAGFTVSSSNSSNQETTTSPQASDSHDNESSSQDEERQTDSDSDSDNDNNQQGNSSSQDEERQTDSDSDSDNDSHQNSTSQDEERQTDSDSDSDNDSHQNSTSQDEERQTANNESEPEDIPSFRP